MLAGAVLCAAKAGEGRPALNEAEGMPSRQPAGRRRYGAGVAETTNPITSWAHINIVELFNT
jgi:hypothetical protein